MQTVIVEGLLHVRKATLEIPSGWYRVLSGATKPGDRFLACDPFWETGEVVWCDLTFFPRSGQPFATAEWFGCLIRRGEPTEMLCPRCHRAPAHLGYRYCRGCAHDVVHELRGD